LLISSVSSPSALLRPPPPSLHTLSLHDALPIYAHLMHPLYDALLDYPHEIDTEKEPGKPSDSAVHDYLVDVLEAEVVEVETQAGSDETVEDAQYQEVE